jgi:hypothetical protein
MMRRMLGTRSVGLDSNRYTEVAAPIAFEDGGGTQ